MCSYVPIIANFGILEENIQLLIFTNLYWIILIFYAGIIKKIIVRENKIEHIKFSAGFQRFIVFTVILTVTYMVFKFNRFRFNLSLDNVYYIRQIYKEKTSAFLSYTKSTLGYFIIPILLLYFYEKKNLLLSFCFALLQILLFTIAKDKLFLFLLGCCFAIILFNKSLKKSFVNVGLIGLISLGAVSWMDAIIRKGYAYIYTLVFRRFLFMPAWLNQLYIQFFSINPKLMWRQDVFFIDKFFTPVYNKSFLLLICDACFGGHEFSPNTGMMAEAFMHFGWVGIFVYPILILVLILILEKLLCNFSFSINLMVAVALMIYMINDVITSTTFAIVYIGLVIFLHIYQLTGNEKENFNG